MEEIERDILRSVVVAVKALLNHPFAEYLLAYQPMKTTKFTRINGKILAEEEQELPVFSVFEFESFALRMRPFFYPRDVCAMEAHVLPLLKSLQDLNPQEADYINEAHDLWCCKQFRSELENRHLSPNFQLIFGRSPWLRDEFFGETYLYGGLFHMNRQEDKWKKYQAALDKAGSEHVLVASVLPFFRLKFIAIFKIAGMCSEILKRLGEPEYEFEFPTVLFELMKDQSTTLPRSAYLTSDNMISFEVNQPFSEMDFFLHECKRRRKIDVPIILNNLDEGEFLRLGESIFFRYGDIKTLTRVGASKPLDDLYPRRPISYEGYYRFPGLICP